jgi:putative transcriptional regulator
MSVKYDKLFALMKDKGITTYRIRKEKIISESALQNLRDGKSVTVETISNLCKTLGCQPGDIMEYIPDERDSMKGAEANATSV